MSLPLFPETIQLELVHPLDKTPTGLTLELVNPEHDDVYEAAVNVIKSLKNKGAKEISDVVQSLEYKIKIASSFICGWVNTSDDWRNIFKRLGFSDDTYSPEKALALLSMKTAAWVRTQIEAAIEEKKSFFKVASND